MKRLTTSDMKRIDLEILKYVKKICDENDLTYYLAYGTLLGAVRHHGFIPWDDDIDIQMPRKDYIKFSRIVTEDKNSRFNLLYLNTDPDYSLPLAKMVDGTTILHQTLQREVKPLGVYIDIFILDIVPESKVSRLILYTALDGVQTLWNAAQNKGDQTSSSIKLKIKQACRHLLWALGPRKFAIILDKLAQRNDQKESKLLGNLTWSSDRKRDTLERTVFDKGAVLEFEGVPFRVPKMYEKYLSHFFGDYMQLPPVEQQQPHHVVEAYQK